MLTLLSACKSRIYSWYMIIISNNNIVGEVHTKLDNSYRLYIQCSNATASCFLLEKIQGAILGNFYH